MQTFLPYPDFYASLNCLDNKRLGKQRAEASQLIKGQWKNHPASKMWKNFRNTLKMYYNISLSLWIERGFVNNMPRLEIFGEVVYPDWLGNKLLHISHRANLLRKDYEFYSKYEWQETPETGYYWPIEISEMGKISKQHTMMWMDKKL